MVFDSPSPRERGATPRSRCASSCAGSLPSARRGKPERPFRHRAGRNDRCLARRGRLAASLTLIDGYAKSLALCGDPTRINRVISPPARRLPATRRAISWALVPRDIARRSRRNRLFTAVWPANAPANGWLFTRYGDVKIRNGLHRDDTRALDASCPATPAPIFARLPASTLQKVN